MLFHKYFFCNSLHKKATQEMQKNLQKIQKATQEIHKNQQPIHNIFCINFKQMTASPSESIKNV